MRRLAITAVSTGGWRPRVSPGPPPQDDRRGKYAVIRHASCLGCNEGHTEMTRILLTGAGFSRNWGGWLASEAFEYLLGCTEIDQETRRLLWRSKESGGGFEDTLADLASAKDAQGKKRYDDLTAALVGMFYAMGQGFSS